MARRIQGARRKPGRASVHRTAIDVGVELDRLAARRPEPIGDRNAPMLRRQIAQRLVDCAHRSGLRMRLLTRTTDSTIAPACPSAPVPVVQGGHEWRRARPAALPHPTRNPRRCRGPGRTSRPSSSRCAPSRRRYGRSKVSLMRPRLGRAISRRAFDRSYRGSPPGGKPRSFRSPAPSRRGIPSASG